MDIISLLKENLGKENIFENEDMSKHTSFKTGGKADIFVKIKNLENLKYLLNLAKDRKIPIFILGNGTNILVRDSGIRGIVCKIEINNFEIEEKEDSVYVKLRLWMQNF